jgi:hypothetical protein
MTTSFRNRYVAASLFKSQAIIDPLTLSERLLIHVALMAVQSMLSLLVSAAKSATASGLKLLPPP